MLQHWYIARAVKTAMSPMIFAMKIQNAYWTTINAIIR